MLKSFLSLTLSAVLLTIGGCATTKTTETVYVPMVAPVIPSSLTPQPIMLFNQLKNGRKLFTLNAEFPYCDPGTGMVIVVPKWYVTDFASVPWYGQSVIDPQGPTARAAIIHDWLYTIGEPGKREVADGIFYRAMIKYGVPEFQARIAYNAVHVGGERGYGLAGDWQFVDPAHQDVKQLPTIPKPRSGAVRIMPKCQGFAELIQSGWRAYPEKPVQIAVPPPVIVTEKPFDNVLKLPGWGKKKTN